MNLFLINYFFRLAVFNFNITLNDFCVGVLFLFLPSFFGGNKAMTEECEVYVVCVVCLLLMKQGGDGCGGTGNFLVE